MKKILIILFFVPFLADAQMTFRLPKTARLRNPSGSTYVRQHLLKELTFEGANLTASISGWTKVQDCCALDGSSSCCLRPVIGQVSTHPRNGSNCARYELHKTDPIVSSSLRAEIEPSGVTDSEVMERWYGMSVYLENWASDDFAESVPIQWHDVDGSCPPLSVQSYDGHLWLKQCIEGGGIANDLGTTASNAWTDIVIHVKWSASGTITSGSGQLQCWVNGTLIVNKNNIRTNSVGGSYLKLGMNKFNWDGTSGLSSSQTVRIFYIDDFRMGDQNATYADVAP